MKGENQKYTEEELRNLPDDKRTKLIIGLIETLSTEQKVKVLGADSSFSKLLRSRAQSDSKQRG